jgi:hypothetical protein
MNVFCRSELGSKSHPMSKVERTMIELMMIVVRWLVSFRSVCHQIVRLATPSLAYWANSGLRGGGYGAIGAPPGIGWMTMRLDPVWCANMSSSPPDAWRGSMPSFIDPPCGGV